MKNCNIFQSKADEPHGQNHSVKTSIIYKIALRWSLIISIILILNSCVNFEEPGIIYDASFTKTNDPSITGITPEGIALGGVREITISGQNLGVQNGTDTDWVFIGGRRAIIKEILGNQTIVIHRPLLANSNYDTKIYLSVTAPKAVDTSANIEYMVESPGEVVGDYGTAFGSYPITAIDFDNQDNIYIVTSSTSSRSVWRNDPSGVTLTQMTGNFSPTSAFSTITDAKFGPGQPGFNLYIVNGTEIIYRQRVDSVVMGTIRPEPVDTLPAAVTRLDFDESGNLYTAGSNGIFMTNLSNGSTSQSLGYEGTENITGIRINYEGTNGYLYVADSLNIWRSQLGAGGSLNGKESLVNLSNISSLSGCTISSFTIDEFGGIYLCLINHPTHSIFFRENDGSITPYYYEDILPNTIELIVWDNDRYLYLISSTIGPNGVRVERGPYASDRIFRMALDKKGVPYQGRRFLQ